jgi:hypothetical protein
MSPSSITCNDCSSQFIFSIAEQQWYESMKFAKPVRCASCRTTKKTKTKAQAQTKEKENNSVALDCVDCSESFDFSNAAQKHYAENGWSNPLRCVPCRTKHKALSPLGICCNMCSKDFMFSVKSQKSYTHNKWKYPVRCRVCHEEYKKTPKVDVVAEADEKAEETVEETVEEKPLEIIE